jgi:hypothetical protein
MLKLLGNYDADLKIIDENKDVFRDLSPEIQNDIIASVSECMAREIKREVSETAFVSLIVDEATDISTKAQVSSVLRCVSKNGDTEERFLHFTELSRERTANALFQHAVVRNRMEPMEGEDKKSIYMRIFLEIIDVMVTNISDRFSDIPKLKFFNLLDQKKFTRFKTKFSDHAMKLNNLYYLSDIISVIKLTSRKTEVAII